MSSYITQGVSLIVLLVLQCSNSLIIRGFAVDGDEPGGECIKFTDQQYYLKQFVQKDKNRKITISAENNSQPLLVKQPNIIITKSKLEKILYS